MKKDLYDELNLTSQDEVLTGDELENAEPDAEDVNDEAEALSDAMTEATAAAAAEDIESDDAQADDDPGTELEETLTEEETPADESDPITDALAALAASVDTMLSRLEQVQSRLEALEAKEAARGKKLSGFFAPIGSDRQDVSSGDLPRIEKKYL